MKERIKIDVSILVGVILASSLLFFFKGLYPQDNLTENVLDFLGIITIIKGVLLRMAARGHKMTFSDKSEQLVTTGPYAFTRNPMYFGSFLIGLGFVLILWPWWMMFLYMYLFYIRFNKEMLKEEKYLKEKFGAQYERYCKEVPRILPLMGKWFKVKAREVTNLVEAFSTKEKMGLLTWPILAIFLEVIKEIIVYGKVDIVNTLIIFLGGYIFFAIVFCLRYVIK